MNRTSSVIVDAAPRSRRRVLRTPTDWICVGWIGFVLLLAVFGPLVTPFDPNLPNQMYANVGAVDGHLLGFDEQGRDLLSRTLAGARTAIFAPTVIAVLAVTVGTALGVAAGWYRGAVDAIIGAVLDLIFSFPGLLLAILAAAVFGKGIAGPVVALSIAFMPLVARVVRSAVLKERVKDYVVAAELQGLPVIVVWLRHLIPNIAPVIMGQSTLVFGYSIASFAAVSYLGLGVQPPNSDWGLMVADGQLGILLGYPMQSLTAGTMIVLTVVAVNVLGERLLRDEGE